MKWKEELCFLHVHTWWCNLLARGYSNPWWRVKITPLAIIYHFQIFLLKISTGLPWAIQKTADVASNQSNQWRRISAHNFYSFHCQHMPRKIPNLSLSLLYLLLFSSTRTVHFAIFLLLWNHPIFSYKWPPPPGFNSLFPSSPPPLLGFLPPLRSALQLP